MKCRYCKKKIENIPFTHGLSKFCNIVCYLHHIGNKNLHAKDGTKNINKKRFKTKTKANITLSKGTKQETIKPDRDSKYITFVRLQPCIVCGIISPNHAHHTETGGMGTKGSDYSCIPLCAVHHTSGTYAIHQIGNNNFEFHFNINLKEIQIKLLRKYIKELYEKKTQI